MLVYCVRVRIISSVCFCVYCFSAERVIKLVITWYSINLMSARSNLLIADFENFRLHSVFIRPIFVPVVFNRWWRNMVRAADSQNFQVWFSVLFRSNLTFLRSKFKGTMLQNTLLGNDGYLSLRRDRIRSSVKSKSLRFTRAMRTVAVKWKPNC